MLQDIKSRREIELNVSLQDVLFVSCIYIHVNGCYVTYMVTQPEAKTQDMSTLEY